MYLPKTGVILLALLLAALAMVSMKNVTEILPADKCPDGDINDLYG